MGFLTNFTNACCGMLFFAVVNVAKLASIGLRYLSARATRTKTCDSDCVTSDERGRRDGAGDEDDASYPFGELLDDGGCDVDATLADNQRTRSAVRSAEDAKRKLERAIEQVDGNLDRRRSEIHRENEYIVWTLKKRSDEKTIVINNQRNEIERLRGALDRCVLSKTELEGFLEKTIRDHASVVGIFETFCSNLRSELKSAVDQMKIQPIWSRALCAHVLKFFRSTLSDVTEVGSLFAATDCRETVDESSAKSDEIDINWGSVPAELADRSTNTDTTISSTISVQTDPGVYETVGAQTDLAHGETVGIQTYLPAICESVGVQVKLSFCATVGVQTDRSSSCETVGMQTDRSPSRETVGMQTDRSNGESVGVQVMLSFCETVGVQTDPSPCEDCTRSQAEPPVFTPETIAVDVQTDHLYFADVNDLSDDSSGSSSEEEDEARVSLLSSHYGVQPTGESASCELPVTEIVAQLLDKFGRDKKAKSYSYSLKAVLMKIEAKGFPSLTFKQLAFMHSHIIKNSVVHFERYTKLCEIAAKNLLSWNKSSVIKKYDIIHVFATLDLVLKTKNQEMANLKIDLDKNTKCLNEAVQTRTDLEEQLLAATKTTK